VIQGTQGAFSLDNEPGDVPQWQYLGFSYPVSEPSVSFTATAVNSSAPVRVVATDTLWCGGGQTTTISHVSAYATKQSSISWQPNLSCPSGYGVLGSRLTASGQLKNGTITLTTGTVNFDWAWYE
jgi:hypothetical protein